MSQIEVQAPPGTTVGYVVQEWHPCLPIFSIQGASKETLLKLKGPFCACNCCSDVTFEVRMEDGEREGERTVTKKEPFHWVKKTMNKPPCLSHCWERICLPVCGSVLQMHPHLLPHDLIPICVCVCQVTSGLGATCMPTCAFERLSVCLLFASLPVRLCLHLCLPPPHSVFKRR